MMRKLSTILICFLVSSCSLMTKETADRKTFPPLPTVSPSASSEEWQKYITKSFQEYFADTTPLVKKTYVVLGQVPQIAEVNCYRVMDECYLSISVSFLRLLSSPDELMVILGHEVGHFRNDVVQLLNGVSLNQTYLAYLEREIAADVFGARSVPGGECYFAKMLPQILNLVEKEQGMASSEQAFIINERIRRMNILCDNAPQ